MEISPESLLEWFRGVLLLHREDDQKRGSAPIILPSAVPERARWMPLIAAMVSASDGAMVDSTILGNGARCGDIEGEAPELVHEVSELLRHYNELYPEAQLRLVIKDGIAIVEGSQSYSASNAAQRAVREIACALCSDELRTTDLAAFVYADDSLAGDIKSLLWSIFMKVPDLLKLSSSSTLIIVGGDLNVDFDLHCTGSRSLRVRIADGGVEWRKRWSHAVTPIERLGSYSKQQMPLITMFLGAGASMVHGLPSGDTFRNEVLSSLTGKPVDRGSFDPVARAWRAEMAGRGELGVDESALSEDDFVNTLTLESVLEHQRKNEGQNFTTSLRSFATIHSAAIRKLKDEFEPRSSIAQVVASRRRIVLVTVNFDHVIETLAGEGNIETFVTESELKSFPKYLADYREHGGAVPLLKLHGDISLPDTLVANISQTIAGLSAERYRAIKALEDAVAQQDMKPWWYVGYSMRDRDLDAIWRGAEFPLLNEFWVSPFLDPNVEKFMRLHRIPNWNGNGFDYSIQDRLVTLTARDFFEVLSDKVTSRW